MTQLTVDAANHRSPAWTPDGKGIVYSSDASGAGTQNLYLRRADGAGDAVRLTTSASVQVAASVHPSGRFILYVNNQANNAGPTPADLWLLPLAGDSEKVGRRARRNRGWTRQLSRRWPRSRPTGVSSPTWPGR